VTVHFKDAIL